MPAQVRLIFSCVIGFAAYSAEAVVRLYEPFDYPVTPASPTTGDRGLDGIIGTNADAGGYPTSSPAPGTTAWFPTNSSGAPYTMGSGGGVPVTSGNLSYPLLAASTGNSVSPNGGTGYSPRRGFYGAPDFDAAGNATGQISSTSNDSVFYS